MHTPRSETKRAIPHPNNELDWLAQIPEEGQTFERIRPIVNANGNEILLLPVVRESDAERNDSDDAASGGKWPSHGPSLDLLAKYTKAFFDREVFVLSPAVVSLKKAMVIKSATRKSKEPGAICLKFSSYSYYDDDSKDKPEGTMDPIDIGDMNHTTGSEYLRRSGKLLVHELGHLYGIDHCIFNRCLMNGTAHLVEDFAAPSHLCGVCLRKLQWRLGFDVKGRYASLATAFSDMGMEKEQKWAQKQYDALAKVVGDNQAK
uniref:Archaemetzincin n=1 Tax=Ditylum brightwellii TaxID=49249 RepID=A0A7S1YSY6_9STRA|mmetsp:Transcript_16624/g.24662  ORF Transcript_16624/g.24662 Transcript_16624/m.24662 type:complete len:261 (+) Transcript_16624:76-858(+)